VPDGDKRHTICVAGAEMEQALHADDSLNVCTNQSGLKRVRRRCTAQARKPVEIALMIIIGACKHARPKAREDEEFEAMERIDMIGVNGRVGLR
jgi:hypothetical protein